VVAAAGCAADRSSATEAGRRRFLDLSPRWQRRNTSSAYVVDPASISVRTPPAAARRTDGLAGIKLVTKLSAWLRGGERGPVCTWCNVCRRADARRTRQLSATSRLN